MTIKVEPAQGGDVSTGTLSTAPKTVKLAPRSMHVGGTQEINLSDINRHLRGKREPVAELTGYTKERETA